MESTPREAPLVKIELRDHLDPARVKDLVARTKEEALAEMVALVATSPAVEDAAALLRAVREREALLSTGIGLGIAIPHARIPSVRQFVVGVGRHATGIEFGSIDGRPVTILVVIAGPQDAQKPYLELLAQLSKRLKLPDVRTRISGSATPAEVVNLLTT
jgi:mannitol/fructose-specific phosphotransferase system IIA component (Ntr-type)